MILARSCEVRNSAMLAEQPEVVGFAVGTRVISCEREWSRPVWHPGSAKEDWQAAGPERLQPQRERTLYCRTRGSDSGGFIASSFAPMPGSVQSTASDLPFLSSQRRQRCGGCSIPALRRRQERFGVPHTRFSVLQGMVVPIDHHREGRPGSAARQPGNNADGGP
jgi:hypothetical protein